MILTSIAEFQKQTPSNTHVYFMGDTFELWEAETVLRSFRSRAHLQKEFQLWDKTTKEVWRVIQPINGGKHVHNASLQKLREHVRKLIKNPLSSRQLDPDLLRQIKSISPRLRSHLTIEANDSDAVVTKKARQLRVEILRRHSSGGVSFEELLNRVSWKKYIAGNHDDILYGRRNGTFMTTDVTIELSHFRNRRTSKNCRLLYMHGHEMDRFNSPQGCGLGVWLTGINTVFEAAKHGDLVKEIKGLFRESKEARENYTDKIIQLVTLWADQTQDIRRHNIVVTGHTHEPYLKNLTNEYSLTERVLARRRARLRRRSRTPTRSQ